MRQGGVEMVNQEILSIIHLCHDLDNSAHFIYSQFAEREEFPEKTRLFWRNVTNDEKMHVRFWEQVEALAEKGDLPQLFSDPEETLRDLGDVANKGAQLEERACNIESIREALLIAYAMEIHLLHPAFETFFHFFNKSMGVDSPAQGYDKHLQKFLSVAGECSFAPLELKLFEDIFNRILKVNRELVVTSNTDMLTGTYNRRGFFSLIHVLGESARRRKEDVGILLMDIDHFKRINDTHGHQAGDVVLSGVAKCIQETVRASDVVGRYGGEEFIVFLPDVQPDTLEVVGEKIRASIIQDSQEILPITISIGGAKLRPMEGMKEELEKTIAKADKLLYRAKESGRNRVIVQND